ncbi:MAG: GntR family transcriptional regulator [Nitrospinota bacterium]
MAITNLKPLRKRLLSENVVGAIRTAIFDGSLELGQRLVETELAEQLGVSRGPVREALRLLATEGLVVINVHRGTFVIKPTAEDVEEIYTLREALEDLAVGRVVDLASDEEIESLVESAEQLEKASQEKQVSRLVDLNMEFHGLLFQYARHERLAQVWANLESQLRLCNLMEIGYTREDMTRARADHVKIAEAIKARDAEGARQLIREHIRHAAHIVQKTAEPALASA